MPLALPARGARLGGAKLAAGGAAYATAVYGQAMSYVPPWTYGYNPYPRVVNSYGAPYPYSPPVYYPNYYYGANPYYGGYYSAPYVGSYVTPYLYGGYYP